MSRGSIVTSSVSSHCGSLQQLRNAACAEEPVEALETVHNVPQNTCPLGLERQTSIPLFPAVTFRTHFRALC